MLPYAPPPLRDLLPGLKRVYLQPEDIESLPGVSGLRGAMNFFDFGGVRDRGLRLIEMDILDPEADEEPAPKMDF